MNRFIHRLVLLAFIIAAIEWRPIALLAAPELFRPIGVARIDVTPAEPIRLTGYGSRKTNSIGIEQRLWAKAFALGSDADGPALLITLDNCGIAEPTYLELVQRLAKKTRLKQDRIAVACSHTHSGPCTTSWAPNIFSQDIPPEQQVTIDRYTSDLVDKLEQVALAALKDRRPGRLAWSQGSMNFARNRRVFAGSTVQFGDNAAGPVDHALPVLLVTDPDGKVRALVANYACHCTTLGGEFNQLHGDWAGCAQEALERESPGAIALITIGCGADANPFPRGNLDLAKQHGEELAAEVKRLLSQTFTPLPAKLSTGLKHIELPFGPQFTRVQWEERAKKPGIVGYHAKKFLARLDRGAKLPDKLSYYVQTWHFGDDLALVFLSGEVVVDYALRLKQDFDPARLWVTAYANYVPCYIPSRRILAEGGYEAEDSLWYYDRPARISTNAEDLIIKTVHGLMPKSFLFDKKKAEFPDPKTPQQALATFRTKRDFVVELVTSEPLIESPVAIDWGADGRLWVCEMYDYPSGLGQVPDTGRKYGEPIRPPPGGFRPGGRIKVLSSSKGDGHYDKATLFLEQIPFPTGVMPWHKGALICAAPNILYAEDTDGDGRADLVRTNYTGFATHNFQARVNGFRWGLDGWLYGSSGLFGGQVKSLLTGKAVDLSGRDFRIKPDTGEIEPAAGISQFGRVRDDFDNWFGNDNSTLLWHYPLAEHYMRRNPHVSYPDPRVNLSSVAADVRRLTSTRNSKPGARNEDHSLPTSAATDPNQLFPASRTLERFNDPQAANRVTSACGPEIYRDDLLGTNYYGNAFICEPVHNLVTRRVLEPDGVTFTAHRAADEERSEFLASTDNWFRPVQVRTGPDGALWVVDMYRFVIEHPRWIPPDRLKQLDPRAGADLGRIYRVYPRGAKLRQIQDLTSRPLPFIALAQDTHNGTARDLAAHLLINREERMERDVRPGRTRIDDFPEGTGSLAVLSSQARTSEWPATRAQALHTLAAVSFLTFADGGLAPDERDTRVLRQAILLSESGDGRSVVEHELMKQRENTDPGVRFQRALSLGYSSNPLGAQELAILSRSDDPWLRAAVLTSAPEHPDEILKSLLAATINTPGRTEMIASLIATAAGLDQRSSLENIIVAIAPPPGRVESWHFDALGSWFEAISRKGITAQSLLATDRQRVREAKANLNSAVTTAQAIVANPTIDEAAREAAIRFLGVQTQQPDAFDQLRVLLKSALSLRLRNAVLSTMRRRHGTDVAIALLADWAIYSPSLRSDVIGLLLTRDEWTRELLGAVERDSVVTSEIPSTIRQQLLKHKDTEIQQRAVKLFQKVSTRSQVLAHYANIAVLIGAADHGAAVFDKNCAQCHAYRGHGHAVGPNLMEFAGKSVQDFLVAILDPNAAINPNFLAYNIDTKDGRSLTGIVRGETASGLTLVQGGGVEEKILRGDIKEIRASQLSLMPEGLEQGMTPQDGADLIAWLKQSYFRVDSPLPSSK